METILPPTLHRQTHSEFLHPRPDLAQCILGGFLRDMRGCGLGADQRFNHFASMPLCALSLMFEGTTRMMLRADNFCISQDGTANGIKAVERAAKPADKQLE